MEHNCDTCRYQSFSGGECPCSGCDTGFDRWMPDESTEIASLKRDLAVRTEERDVAKQDAVPGLTHGILSLYGAPTGCGLTMLGRIEALADVRDSIAEKKKKVESDLTASRSREAGLEERCAVLAGALSRVRSLLCYENIDGGYSVGVDALKSVSGNYKTREEAHAALDSTIGVSGDEPPGSKRLRAIVGAAEAETEAEDESSEASIALAHMLHEEKTVGDFQKIDRADERVRAARNERRKAVRMPKGE